MHNTNGYVVFKNITNNDCNILTDIINNYTPTNVDSINREDTDITHTCNI